ncbi:hypothetical protein J9978_09185 [Chromobacterium violaceum]|uniref:gamma-mobile-trio protein GmtX n=1 Tax=Chromobacterium violaceum TaxID=536 RepID=UPI001B328B76|nr:gamma-mobile-trio protein GmtX [Chromobacterium violaceum]MBP4049672.1 hypothetical protein [Chromobacterium violaceum]
MRKSEHPDIVLSEFLEKKPRPQKVKNLQAIHEICRINYEAGSRDFSISAIGKQCEERGLLKARGLYNAPLADYRALIEAWASYAGPAAPKPKQQLATEDYLTRIEDPAIRMLVQGVIAERNKLKAQLNTLKSATTIVVDRRPAETTYPLAGPSHAKGLTHSERQALLRAVSAEFLAEQGWRETELGEVINARGRTVFDPGFATGLRKLLW